MDGLFTFVLSYQDATGQVFTSRVITNNPNAEVDECNVSHLTTMFRKGGYELLTIQKLEELGMDLEGAATQAGRQKQATMYRFALFGILAIVAVGMWLDIEREGRMEGKMDTFTTELREGNNRMHARMDTLEKNQRGIAYRLSGLEDLERQEQAHK